MSSRALLPIGLALGALAPIGCSSDGGSTSAGASAPTSSTGGAGASASSGGAPADGGATGTGAAGPNLTCGEPTNAGPIVSTALVEASGLAASKVHPGVFYAHNDSGDTARFFAIGPAGEDQGTFDVAGATAIDWEDMARGPCDDPKKSCLYFGDIGDNGAARATYALYRVEEPPSLGAGPHTTTAETFTFKYPDGPHDAEALLVHPDGRVFIVTKTARTSRLYAFPTPLDPRGTTTLSLVGDVEIPDLLPLVTGGDIRPSGDGVLLRTYASVWFYPVPKGGDLGAALATSPVAVPAPSEPQGEAIAWTAAGDGYRTLSEGASEVLHAVSCR